MERQVIYSDGTPVPRGICIMPSTYVATFTVEIRSMHPISAESLKDLIQGRHEVTECEKTKETCVAAGKSPYRFQVGEEVQATGSGLYKAGVKLTIAERYLQNGFPYYADANGNVHREKDLNAL